MIEIKVEGLSELERRLREFGPKVAKNGLRAANFAGARVFRDDIKRAAPVRSGLLKANVVAVKRRSSAETEAKHTVTIRDKPKVTKVVRRKSTGKYREVAGPKTYGRFLEFGTSKMPARPFVRPVVANDTEKAIEAVKARLAKAVEDAAKR